MYTVFLVSAINCRWMEVYPLLHFSSTLLFYTFLNERDFFFSKCESWDPSNPWWKNLPNHDSAISPVLCNEKLLPKLEVFPKIYIVRLFGITAPATHIYQLLKPSGRGGLWRRQLFWKTFKSLNLGIVGGEKSPQRSSTTKRADTFRDFQIVRGPRWDRSISNYPLICFFKSNMFDDFFRYLFAKLGHISGPQKRWCV